LQRFDSRLVAIFVHDHWIQADDREQQDHTQRVVIIRLCWRLAVALPLRCESMSRAGQVQAVVAGDAEIDQARGRLADHDVRR
jgi:hypothetical protein